jgi:hypothetical protein
MPFCPRFALRAELPLTMRIIVNVSGRGDKDVQLVAAVRTRMSRIREKFIELKRQGAVASSHSSPPVILISQQPSAC